MDIAADIQTRRGYQPGLIGRVTELHALYYQQHWNFGSFFELRVATEISAFIDRYDADEDCIWSVSIDQRIEASIAIDAPATDKKLAHIRWFITSDACRGIGLGSQLIEAAIAFCRKKHYPGIYLNTFAGLEAAQHLYQRSGFELVETRAGNQWGNPVDEQVYHLLLPQ